MKSWILLGGGAAALGVAAVGVDNGHDVHRTVRLPISTVYNGFDTVFTPRGPMSVPVSATESPDGQAGRLVATVERVQDRSFHLSFSFRERPVLALSVAMEPGANDTTELVADADLDMRMISKLGDGIGAPPKFVVDQLGQVLATKLVDKVLTDLYAGRTPTPFETSSLLPRRGGDPLLMVPADDPRMAVSPPDERPSRQEERWREEERMREAAKPMLDPNESARKALGE